MMAEKRINRKGIEEDKPYKSLLKKVMASVDEITPTLEFLFSNEQKIANRVITGIQITWMDMITTTS